MMSQNPQKSLKFLTIILLLLLLLHLNLSFQLNIDDGDDVDDDDDDDGDSLTYIWPLPSNFTSGDRTLSVDPSLSLIFSG